MMNEPRNRIIVALRNEKDTTLIDNRIFTIHFQLIEFQYLKIH